MFSSYSAPTAPAFARRGRRRSLSGRLLPGLHAAAAVLRELVPLHAVVAALAAGGAVVDGALAAALHGALRARWERGGGASPVGALACPCMSEPAGAADGRPGTRRARLTGLHGPRASASSRPGPQPQQRVASKSHMVQLRGEGRRAEGGGWRHFQGRRSGGWRQGGRRGARAQGGRAARGPHGQPPQEGSRQPRRAARRRLQEHSPLDFALHAVAGWEVHPV